MQGRQKSWRLILRPSPTSNPTPRVILICAVRKAKDSLRQPQFKTTHLPRPHPPSTSAEGGSSSSWKLSLVAPSQPSQKIRALQTILPPANLCQAAKDAKTTLSFDLQSCRQEPMPGANDLIFSRLFWGKKIFWRKDNNMKTNTMWRELLAWLLKSLLEMMSGQMN